MRMKATPSSPVVGPAQGDHVFNDVAALADRAREEVLAKAGQLRADGRLSQSLSQLSEARTQFAELRSRPGFAVATAKKSRPRTEIGNLMEQNGLGGDRNSQTFSQVQQQAMKSMHDMLSGNPSRLTRGYTVWNRLRDNIGDTAFDSNAAERLQGQLRGRERQRFDQHVEETKASMTTLMDETRDAALTLNRLKAETQR